MPRAYLPGLAVHGASKLFAGDAKVEALVGSVGSSCRSHPAAVACEDRAVRLLARRIPENAAEIESPASEISSVSAPRQGNKRLKNLLIFSRNCLARSRNRWGDYHARRRERGMPHGKSLKAVARKRLKVIYAVGGQCTPSSCAI